jgi:hypothetical protein
MGMRDEGRLVDFDGAEFCPGRTQGCGVVRVCGARVEAGDVFLVPEEDPSSDYWELIVCTFADGCGAAPAGGRFDKELFVRARPGTRGFQVVGATVHKRFDLPADR